MKGILSPLRKLGQGMLLAAGVLLASLFGPVVVQTLQTQYWPVLYDWRPAVVTHAGDLIVTGTMRKRRTPACEYVPPQRVLDLDSGAHMPLKSLAPAGGTNWQGDDELRAFGPWLVVGGAGKRLQFYSEHECSPLWRSFSVLGVVDTRSKP